MKGEEVFVPKLFSYNITLAKHVNSQKNWIIELERRETS